ncbi:MAG: hypothetical protein WD768_02955 [Phycisphaeraceae bacterium]
MVWFIAIACAVLTTVCACFPVAADKPTDADLRSAKWWLARAEEETAKLTKPHHQAETSANLAVVCAKNNQIDAFAVAAKRASDAGGRLSDVAQYVMVKSRLAVSFAIAKDANAFQAIVDQFNEQLQILIELDALDEQVEIDQSDHARERLRKIKSMLEKVKLGADESDLTCLLVASIEMRLGLFDQSRQTMKAVGSKWIRVGFLARFTVEQVRQGASSVVEAQGGLSSIEKYLDASRLDNTADVYREIVKAYAAIGDIENALRVLERVTGPVNRAAALCELARAQSDKKDRAACAKSLIAAKLAVESISVPDERTGDLQLYRAEYWSVLAAAYMHCDQSPALHRLYTDETDALQRANMAIGAADELWRINRDKDQKEKAAKDAKGVPSP